ncbi:macro domain-containing protein [Posidoniimonas corsicana]|nr:macro domain-containing protein [Posidoniimonas corsicana]
MPLPIEIWLIHPEREAAEAFSERFEGLPTVRVIQTAYEGLDAHDCFVTAANCYGIMNAGIDAAVVRLHGVELCKRIQHRILDEFLGEQPVGTAIIEPTGSSHSLYVCHAPTMRVPGSIRGTDNVYLATFAALTAVYRYNTAHDHPIRTVVLPAMGCGFGGMDYSESGRQMAAAYKHYLSPPHQLDWNNVIEREKRIRYDGEQQVVR